MPNKPLRSPADMAIGHTMRLADDGVLDINIHGVWTIEQTDRFFGELAPIHAAARARHGRVLALIVVGTVQAPLVALHVRNRAVAIKRPGDRNAVVVATFLSKLQITRVANGEDFGVFTDLATAREWLLRLESNA